MIKKLLLASAFLLVSFGVGLTLFAHIRHGQQVAIMAVISQSNAALTQTHVFPNGRTVNVHPREKLFSIHDYTKAIERVPTTDCPEQFSIAWLQYVQTLERNNTPFAGLGAIGEYELSVIKPNGEVTKDALARLDRLNAPEAWRHVVMVALHYGVQIHPQ